MIKKMIAMLVVPAMAVSAADVETIDSTGIFKSINLNEVEVSTSYRETAGLKDMPLSVSLFDGRTTDGLRINSIKDISTLAPNFYMPDYGSKLTSTMFIRGVGSRLSSSAVSLYVDDVPYIDKSSFDFQLFDIESIEILRGPQGTLYGRNSLGGVIQIRTRSPFKYEGTKIQVGGGNYGQMKATLSRYGRLSERVGYSLSGYYDGNNGYFTNQYTGKRDDQLRSAGGRMKFAWNINDLWRSELTTSYDYTDQGGYPYGLYDDATGRVNPVNYNDTCSYRRAMTNNSLLFQFRNDKVLFTSTTAYQYLDDKMQLDQDFSPLSIFTMSQAQKSHTINQEFTVKSNTSSNWQWVFGASGFYQTNTTVAPVLFKEDGIRMVLQPVFDDLYQSGAMKVKLSITDKQIPIDGTYKLPTYSLGVYHQSTINNLLTEGLSLTLGLRLEHERLKLDHYTATKMNISATVPGPPRPPMTMELPGKIEDNESLEYTQLLPKIALKYDITPRHAIYGTVSKGYKSGGFNFQMFSDLIQEELMGGMPSGGGGEKPKKSYTDRITYKPEYNWNYEVGYRAEWIKDHLFADLALFYINISDQQITQFAPNGFGRMARNAGGSVSKGAEFSLNAKVNSRFSANASYGYTHATFTQYDNGKEPTDEKYEDYAGNYVPLAPMHTLSLAANYTVPICKNPVIDNLVLWAQYAGNGKIYWTEHNDRSQDFYGLVNAKASLSKGIVRLDLWAKNIFNTTYQAFYFESMSKPFVQLGRPTQMGVDVAISF